MSIFAIIESGGKQYKVSAGDKIKVEKLNAETNGKFSFDKVLLVSKSDEVDLGTPYVGGARVEAKILSQAKNKKKIVFKYHSKTRYRKKKGHRQHFTEVEITKINL